MEQYECIKVRKGVTDTKQVPLLTGYMIQESYTDLQYVVACMLLRFLAVLNYELRQAEMNSYTILSACKKHLNVLSGRQKLHYCKMHLIWTSLAELCATDSYKMQRIHLLALGTATGNHTIQVLTEYCGWFQRYVDFLHYWIMSGGKLKGIAIQYY
jgi:hypothetical protein